MEGTPPLKEWWYQSGKSGKRERWDRRLRTTHDAPRVCDSVTLLNCKRLSGSHPAVAFAPSNRLTAAPISSILIVRLERAGGGGINEARTLQFPSAWSDTLSCWAKCDAMAHYGSLVFQVLGKLAG